MTSVRRLLPPPSLRRFGRPAWNNIFIEGKDDRAGSAHINKKTEQLMRLENLSRAQAFDPRHQILAGFGYNGIARLKPSVTIGDADADIARMLARTLRSLLFGVSPLDHLSFAAVPLLLAVAVTLASFLPASRVAAVNPVDALKGE